MELFIAVMVVLLVAGISLAVSQEVKERKQRESRLEECRIVEPVEVYNGLHHGIGSVLWGELEDGTRIKTSPIELILNGGNVVETRSGSRYVLR